MLVDYFETANSVKNKNRLIKFWYVVCLTLLRVQIMVGGCRDIGFQFPAGEDVLPNSETSTSALDP
jgi:hypothetical protein